MYPCKKYYNSKHVTDKKCTLAIKSEGKESSKNFKSSKVVKETATNKLNIILAENMVKL